MPTWQWLAKPFERQSRTIRFRIVSLVSFILVPLIVLLAWLVTSFATAKRDLIELQRLDITNRLSAAVDLDIASNLGMLRGLSASEALKLKNFEDFKRQSGTMLALSHVSRIWIFDQNGDVVTGAFARKSDGTFETLNAELTGTVFGGGDAVSSVRGEGLNEATVIVAVPVFDGEAVIYGLAGQISVSHLSSIFSDIGMDPRWPAAVVDRKGQFVARSLDAERRIGQLARPELGAAARGERIAGTFENTTWEGLAAINAFRRSSVTGWTSVVAVPKAELTAPIREAVILTSLGVAVLLTVTTLSAAAMASRISEPVRDLCRYARALAGGEPYQEVDHQIVELDEVRMALDEAISRNAHLAALIASSGDAILSIDLDGTIRTWNKGAEVLFGYAADEIIGKPKAIIVPEDRLGDFEEQRSKILEGESIRSETVRVTKDGTHVSVLVNAAPIRRFDGKIIAMSSVLHDVSAIKAAEEHRLVLMRELSHRSKNQLAVIQSIAGQTARSAVSVEEFLSHFQQRLQGIAVSHDLLADRDWRGAPLRELVERHLKPFVGEEGGKVLAFGPAIDVEASAAEAVGLALHELATNSLKYGALSKPEGRVYVKWALSSGDPSSEKLSLEWTEKDGPPIKSPPTQKGFGSRIIEHLVASVVSGESVIQYRPEGVYWRLEYELSKASQLHQPKCPEYTPA